MLNVFITIDTEIWCNGWDNLDECFPGYFQQYVYGKTSQGDYALPGTLNILADHGLPAVFFVEPLFSARFGIDPLAELVGLIKEQNQEIQLHLHPEWVDETGETLLTNIQQKIPLLSLCDLSQQSQLIAWGKSQLHQVGVENITAFRAGSYAANLNTLQALKDNQILFDSSYNPASDVGVADIAPGQILTQPYKINDVYEYPVSVFAQPVKNSQRNLQVTACSFNEMSHYLNTAHDAGWDAVVIVSHNFELLSPNKIQADHIVINRFKKLCQFLSQNPERFKVTGFNDLTPTHITDQPELLNGKPVDFSLRTMEQITRRFMYK